MLDGVLAWSSIVAMKYRDQKASWGEKGLFGLCLHTDSHGMKSGQELKQGRNLKAGADAEAMERAAYWLASTGLLSLLSYRTQDHQPRDGTTHNGLGPLTSVTNEEDALWLNLMETFSQLRFPPLQ